MSSKNKVIVSWEMVEAICLQIAEDLKAKGKKYDGIIGLARGGAIPAVLIAGALGVRTVKTVQFSRYHEGVPGDIHCSDNLDALCVTGSWLIVDDIVGTGDTYQAARRFLPGMDFCSLLVRPEMHDKVYAGVHLKEGDGWIVFPWERVRTTDGVQDGAPVIAKV